MFYLLPTGIECRNNTQGLVILAANGSNIKTYGRRAVTLDLPPGRFQCTFVLEDVSRLNLGADFLRANFLFVDMKHQRLVNAESFTSIPLQKSTFPPVAIHATSLSSNTSAILLADFPQISTPQFFKPHPAHGVEHFIPTNSPPVHSRVRPLPNEKLALAKSKFHKMLEMEIICLSSSPWASPLYLVHKASGGWRPFGDYCRLNAATRLDPYPIPHIQDSSAYVEATIFSKID